MDRSVCRWWHLRTGEDSTAGELLCQETFQQLRMCLTLRDPTLLEMFSCEEMQTLQPWNILWFHFWLYEMCISRRMKCVCVGGGGRVEWKHSRSENVISMFSKTWDFFLPWKIIFILKVSATSSALVPAILKDENDIFLSTLNGTCHSKSSKMSLFANFSLEESEFWLLRSTSDVERQLEIWSCTTAALCTS